jgi:hypothetical protein
MEKENRLSKKKELPKNTGLRAVRIALPMTYTLQTQIDHLKNRKG